MTCKITRDDDGKVIGIVCSTPWGIGTCVYRDDDGSESVVYGFPWGGMDPNDFTPDSESCSEVEITSWKEAREAWNAAQKEEKRDGE